jgi:hypothetical protein
MAENKSFDVRVQMVEEHLVAEAAKASRCTAIMASAREIFRDRGQMRVGIYANEAALSVRQYERRFLDEIA